MKGCFTFICLKPQSQRHRAALAASNPLSCSLQLSIALGDNYYYSSPNIPALALNDILFQRSCSNDIIISAQLSSRHPSSVLSYLKTPPGSALTYSLVYRSSIILCLFIFWSHSRWKKKTTSGLWGWLSSSRGVQTGFFALQVVQYFYRCRPQV